MPTSKKTIKITASFALFAVAISASIFFWNQTKDESERSSVRARSGQNGVDEPALSVRSQTDSLNAQNLRGAGQPDGGVAENSSEETRWKIENGQLNGEAAFTRSNFFMPINWGAEQRTLSGLEAQTLVFRPSCAKHPRAQETAAHPASWTEPFTHTDSLSRWPAASAHVIDWNQFWKTGDKGIQVSIRWNFELPPRYTVVGYSFSLQTPDGHGTSIFPDNPEMSWEEAKSYVTSWEKKTLAEGGIPATRTMSLADRPFNPADVSTEDIERAEFNNSRVRAAQTGKMICNSSPTSLLELSCSCWE